LLAGERPLGKRFNVGEHAPPIEIVGVAQDGKYFSLTESRKPAYFEPLDISYSQAASLVARTTLSGAEAVSGIRSAVRELDPALPLYDAGTLGEQLALPLFPARIAALVLSAFGFLAVILAATGIYGVMAYSVARRTREIGIRMALGARRGAVVWMVLRDVLLLTGMGLLISVPAALGASKLIESMLFGVKSGDPASMAAAIAILLGAALVAGYLPARKASRIDPMAAVRHE